MAGLQNDIAWVSFCKTFVLQSGQQDYGIMKMPKEQLPLVLIAWSWIESHGTIILSTLLCFVTAYVRAIYYGSKRKQAAIDAFLCGLIWLGISNSLGMFGLSSDASGFIAVLIAFLGVDKIRDILNTRATKIIGGTETGQ